MEVKNNLGFAKCNSFALVTILSPVYLGLKKIYQRQLLEGVLFIICSWKWFVSMDYLSEVGEMNVWHTH